MRKNRKRETLMQVIRFWMGFYCFAIHFFGMSLNHTILNHNAIAGYCLIIPGDDIDEEKRLCMCVCSVLCWIGEVCWRKCVKYVCHIRFDIEFLNQNCLRLLSWLWCAHCLLRYRVHIAHTPILSRSPTQMGQQTLLLFFLLLLAHVLSTLFKSNQNFFNIFRSCWFSIRHLSFTYKSSIKISHIMELNINFWFTGNDTSYQCKYVRIRIYRSHLPSFLSRCFLFRFDSILKFAAVRLSWFIRTGAQTLNRIMRPTYKLSGSRYCKHML